MENPYHNILLNITNYFVRNGQSQKRLENCRNITTLVRIHNEKLAQLGEASFSCKPEIWAKYFQAIKGIQLNEDAFALVNETEEKPRKLFLNQAKMWSFPVTTLVVRQERCHLYLQRHSIMENLIQQVLGDPHYGYLRKLEANGKVHIKPLLEYGLNQQDLSFHRAQLMHQTLQKLVHYSSWSTYDDTTATDSSILELNVLSVASKVSQDLPKPFVTIKCGLVTDPLTKGKICHLPTQEYLSLRSNDMTLMALHKYGVRVKQDARFRDLMERLGCAAVTVDLLEVKHTSPVQIIRNGQGSTKGASFILYNSARLESILRTFEERIESRTYEPLPEMTAIDWSLLKEEEEWQLVFAYLAGFPDLIDRCVEHLERGICSTHLIIRFLHGLVAIFSVYYRRIRILTEKRDQLMPFVYARIYLIRAIREVLNKTLSLLDIQPVEFM